MKITSAGENIDNAIVLIQLLLKIYLVENILSKDSFHVETTQIGSRPFMILIDLPKFSVRYQK